MLFEATSEFFADIGEQRNFLAHLKISKRFKRFGGISPKFLAPWEYFLCREFSTKPNTGRPSFDKELKKTSDTVTLLFMSGILESKL